MAFTGRFDVQFLEDAVSRIQEHNARVAAELADTRNLDRKCAEAKHELRIGRRLQRGIKDGFIKWSNLTEKEKEIYALTEDDLLRKRLNMLVLKLGRGRTRGTNPENYVDLGTQRERDSVSNYLDGPRERPDTQRFERL